MSQKVTRRQFGTAIAGSLAPLALRARAQEIRSLPQEALAAAKAEVRKDTEVLDKFQIPMATEPAFRFEA